MTSDCHDHSQRDRECAKSASGVHAVDRQRVARFDRGLHAICRHCGAQIHRAHRKSSIWWATTHRVEPTT